MIVLSMVVDKNEVDQMYHNLEVTVSEKFTRFCIEIWISEILKTILTSNRR